MASPTMPAVEPSDREIEGRTGAKIRTSTDTRKANAKKRTSGVTDIVRRGAAARRREPQDTPQEKPGCACRLREERHAGPSERCALATGLFRPSPLLDHHHHVAGVYRFAGSHVNALDG